MPVLTKVRVRLDWEILLRGRARVPKRKSEQERKSRAVGAVV
jgi:hypothetical protein